MTASESAAAARHAASGEQGPLESQVPAELNELLGEQTPGRRNANFRLACRDAWVRSQSGETVAIEWATTQQAAVVARLIEMCGGRK
jgi:hypothetical protein